MRASSYIAIRAGDTTAIAPTRGVVRRLHDGPSRWRTSYSAGIIAITTFQNDGREPLVGPRIIPLQTRMINCASQFGQIYDSDRPCGVREGAPAHHRRVAGDVRRRSSVPPTCTTCAVRAGHVRPRTPLTASHWYPTGARTRDPRPKGSLRCLSEPLPPRRA